MTRRAWIAAALVVALGSGVAYANMPHGRNPFGLIAHTLQILAAALDAKGNRIYDSTDELNLGASAEAGSATTAGSDVLVGSDLEVDGVLYADGNITLPAAGTVTATGRAVFKSDASGFWAGRNSADNAYASGFRAQSFEAYDSGTNRTTVFGENTTTVSDGCYGWGSSASVVGTADTLFCRGAAGDVSFKTTSGVELGRIVEGWLSTTAAVDWNVTTKTTLYTCPSGRACYITKVVERDASGTPTIADCAYGWNANADDVIATSTNTALAAATYRIRTPIGSSTTAAAEGAAAGVFGIQCDVAEGGALTVTIDVYGYSR